MQLEGKTAIVTGAAQGLGEAFARRLVAEGCAVVTTDREEHVVDVADSIGAAAHVGDVADAAHVRSVVDATLTAHGGIDILVNNAGEVWSSGPLDEWDRADGEFDQAFGSNVKGHFLFGRAVAQAMIERANSADGAERAGGNIVGGNIVNVSTDHVKPGPGCDRHHGHGYMDLYNASKWAINGLTFDWAKSLAKYGIRVNNLCMGATDTAMLRGWIGREPDPEVVATWMRPDQTAQVLVDLLLEGPDGRTGDSIGLYVGQPCVLPPPE